MDTLQQEIAKNYGISEVEVSEELYAAYKILRNFEDRNKVDPFYIAVKNRIRVLVSDIKNN